MRIYICQNTYIELYFISRRLSNNINPEGAHLSRNATT
jgi:hypothetical protein